MASRRNDETTLVTAEVVDADTVRVGGSSFGREYDGHFYDTHKRKPMKFTRVHERQLREYLDCMDLDGCVKPDCWTTGSGRYTSKKAIPPFVTREERKTTVNHIALSYFLRNPKCHVVYVLDRESLYSFLFDAAHGKEF